MFNIIVICIFFISFIFSGCSSSNVKIPKYPVTQSNVLKIERITRSSVPEFYPQLSPDKKKILFQVEDKTKYGRKKWSIFLKYLEKVGRVAVVGPYAIYGSWYPDSESIIFTYLKGTKPKIASLSLKGGGITIILQSSEGETYILPSVSPNGKDIAFECIIDGSSNICTSDMKGSKITIYTEGKNPKWHPEKSKLVFQRKVGKYWHIFTLNLETGELTQLTDGNFNDVWPSYSPDGNWIAFISNRDGKYHLYIMKSDGSYITQLTKGNSEELHPSWGKDGYIYFVSNAGAPKMFNNKWEYTDIWRLKVFLPK